MGTQTWVMDYPDRAALIADGWDFFAKTEYAHGLENRNTEVPASILYNTGGGLTIDPADSGELWGGTNTQKNIIFRDLPSDWEEITAKLRFTPSSNYHHAGVMLYEHDNDYIASLRNWSSNFMSRRDTGGQASQFFGAASSVNPFWVRVVKLLNNNYGVQWSIDGVNFTQITTEYNTFPYPTRLALSVSGGGTSSADATFYEASVTAPSIGEPEPPTGRTAYLGDKLVSLYLGDKPVTAI